MELLVLNIDNHRLQLPFTLLTCFACHDLLAGKWYGYGWIRTKGRRWWWSDWYWQIVGWRHFHVNSIWLSLLWVDLSVNYIWLASLQGFEGCSLSVYMSDPIDVESHLWDTQFCRIVRTIKIYSRLHSFYCGWIYLGSGIFWLLYTVKNVVTTNLLVPRALLQLISKSVKYCRSKRFGSA